MKKSLVKSFKVLAQQCPEVLETIHVGKTGAQLLREGVKYTDKGDPIRPDRTYRQPQKKAVNHAEKIKDAFKKNGMPGVQAYVNQFLPHAPVVSQKIEHMKAEAAKYSSMLDELTINETASVLPEDFDNLTNLNLNGKK